VKALLLFTACLASLSVLLLLVDADRADPARLPERPPPAGHEAVLVGADLADEYGTVPFAGRLRRLENFELRVVEDEYVKLYLNLGRLARHENRPRLEDVTGAVFDPPRAGRPNLRLTLHAPSVSGQLGALLHGARDAPRVATLFGGVVARDPTGRPLARIETLRVDVRSKTVASDDPVRLSLPEEGVEVRGVGLFADLDLRSARLEQEVTAWFRREDERARLACAGPATVREVEDGHLVTLENRARITHAFGTATCRRIVAEVGEGALRRAVLEGHVLLELDPASARGLERVSMPRVTLEGDRRLLCAGPVHAIWRGQAAILGLGERTLALEAGRATLLLRRGAGERLELEEARFDGEVRAADRDGPGRLEARLLTVVREGATLEAAGGVVLRAPEGRLRADHLLLKQLADDAHELTLRGVEEITYVADGKLGPLGQGARGTLRLQAAGPVRLLAKGEEITFHARDKVVATIDDRSRLEGEEISLAVRGGELSGFAATGDVLLRDRERGAEVRAHRLTYRAGTARVEGRPARITLPDARRVEAATLVYRDDQTFTAEGEVRVTARLARGKERSGVWRVRCATARGKLASEGLPDAIVAEGGVAADGPGGQHLAGERFEYRGQTRRARLTGKPALLRRGDELQVAATGFECLIVENEVEEALATGAVAIDFRPRRPRETEAAAFAHWRIELDGPAQLRQQRLVAARGGRLRAFDAQGEPGLAARARQVVVTLERTREGLRARALQGGGGVEIERLGKDPAKVTADRLDYRAGSRRVEIHGNARVEARGWPREMRFERVVFVITKDGIDLQRATGIEVRD
jgi:lipopolysaccharide export system protein LptA